MSSPSTSSPWTRKKIVCRIAALHAEGEDLSYNCMAEERQDLLSAANYHFGSWRDAVIAAGVDYDRQVRRIPKWTRERIVQVIRAAHEADEDLSWSSVSKHPEYSGLAYAAIRDSRFGSWDDALRAADIQPSEVRRYESWSVRKVLRRIRGRAEAGGALNAQAAQRGDGKLFNAAVKRFGGWADALRAAGLDPDDHSKRRRWDRSIIVTELRRLAGDGIRLSATHMRRHHCALYSAACKHFGSWTAARSAAEDGKV